MEECIVPECPSRKVAIDSSGNWHAVHGNELLSYICQSGGFMNFIVFTT